MKNKIHLLLFFLIPLLSSAQTTDSGMVITLHPAVGNTITANEKKQFDLFTEYNDSLFESAQIVKYNDSTYAIRLKTIQGNFFERETDSKELHTIYEKIERIKPVEKDEYVENKRNSEQLKKDKQEDRINTGFQFSQMFFELLVITLEVLVAFSR
jgi:Na+-transporting NADH:ubiquinone oxidoreductase subunit NqrC